MSSIRFTAWGDLSSGKTICLVSCYLVGYYCSSFLY